MQLRFKLPWAMILVAIVAIAIGPGYRYARTLHDRADLYRGMAKAAEINAQSHFRRSKKVDFEDESRERFKKVGEWYLSRRDRYRRAALFPVFEVPVEWEPWATVPYRFKNGTLLER